MEKNNTIDFSKLSLHSLPSSETEEELSANLEKWKELLAEHDLSLPNDGLKDENDLNHENDLKNSNLDEIELNPLSFSDSTDWQQTLAIIGGGGLGSTAFFFGPVTGTVCTGIGIIAGYLLSKKIYSNSKFSNSEFSNSESKDSGNPSE